MYFYIPIANYQKEKLRKQTTKRRTTTNLKTKNNQNCQKVELYGSPTIKELKKKHSSRPAGGVEMGSQVERTPCKEAAERLGWVKWQLVNQVRWQLVDPEVPYSCADKPRGITGV